MTTWLLPGALVITCTLAGAQAKDDGDVLAPARFAEARHIARRCVEDKLSPGVSVAVVQDDELVWAEGFGYADVENRRPATSNSIYRLASISKPITATGLLILADRGKVDLNAPANRYLGEHHLKAWRGSADAMTLRRLLNHTSGLPLHYTFFYDGVQPPAMDETIRRYGFAATTPGTAWQYSNLAFGILGFITARVAERPWPEFLRDELFDRIGMKRTAAGIREGFERDATRQYMMGPGGRFVRVGDYGFDHPGASAIWSTVHDLVRFSRLHYRLGELDGVRILRPDTARAMQTTTWDRGNGRGIGLAWMTTSVRGQRCIYHTGGMPGVAAMLRVFPDRKSVTVVLTNSSNRTTYARISDALAKALFPDAEPSATRSSPAASREQSGKLFGTWTGKLVHWADGDIPLRLTIEASKATVRLGAKLTRELDNVHVTANSVSGTVDGLFLQTTASFHGRPRLDFQLRKDGDTLAGVCIARAEHYFAVSYWVELRQEASAGK